MNPFKVSDYKSTGCYPVDLVLNCVAFYRKCNRPLKSITLSRYNYKKFRDYMINEHFKFDVPEEEVLYCDSVPVKCAQSAIIQDIYCDFWPTERTEENDEKFIK